MNTRTNTFSRLVALFLLYIFLVAVGFFVYAVIIGKPDDNERGATIAGILGWTATLYAPIAAFFIIDVWKDQVKHQKALDHLSNAYSLIGKFERTLQRLRSDRKYTRLGRIYNKTSFSEFQDYLLKLEIQFLDETNILLRINDDIQNELSLYKLALGEENLDFNQLTVELLIISYGLNNVYSKFVELHLDAKEEGDPYIALTRLPEFETLFYEVSGYEFRDGNNDYNDNSDNRDPFSKKRIGENINFIKIEIMKMRNEL